MKSSPFSIESDATRNDCARRPICCPHRMCSSPRLKRQTHAEQCFDLSTVSAALPRASLTSLASKTCVRRTKKIPVKRKGVTFLLPLRLEETIFNEYK